MATRPITIKHVPDLRGVPENIRRTLEQHNQYLYQLLDRVSAIPGTNGNPVPVGPIVPTGAINGKNLNFTLPDIPSAFLMVWLNGVLQVRGTPPVSRGTYYDFTLSGKTITMATAPSVNANLLAAYFK